MPNQKTKQELDLNYYAVYIDYLPGVPSDVDTDFHLRWREVDTIVRAIKAHKAKMIDVTIALGITRHALRRKLVKFGIPKLEAWRDSVTDWPPRISRSPFSEERPPDPGVVVGGDQLRSSLPMAPAPLLPEPAIQPVPAPRDW